MPVDTPHPEYDKRIKQWRRCRDTAEGTDAVKDRKSEYLPMLSGMDDDEYEAYLMRALFYGAMGRTVQGLLGAVFRRDPLVEYPPRFADHLEDLTVDGLSHVELARRVVEEDLTLGRLGLLADVAQEGAPRAYVSVYSAQNIVNWSTAKIEGRQVLTRVVLRETVDVADLNDEFMTESVTQYRVLLIEDGRYLQRIYREARSASGVQYAQHDEIVPIRLGQRLDFIPFQFVAPFSLSIDTQKSPLLDLCDVNLSHYRSSADLEHGAHYTALPTAIIAGFDSEDGPYKIGSGVAWSTTNTEAKAWFLEYTGKGLDSLRDLKRDKEQLMAVLGARLLEEQKRAAEAAETKKLNRSGEEGSLTALAGTCSQALAQALRWVAWWSGNQADDAVQYRLNTDFVSTLLSPQELTALIAARQSGEMSQETFLYNLKRGEMLPPDRTIEDERDLIETEEPTL